MNNWYNKISSTKVLKYCSLLTIALFIMILSSKSGIYFNTNDDRFISEILSGGMTGFPEPHAVFINYFLSFPLTLLYRLTTSIPWYGCFLVFVYLVSFFIIFKCFLDDCQSKVGFFLITTMLGALFLSVIIIYGLIQFTSVAAILALSGYVLLLKKENNSAVIVSFFLLELVASFIRIDAMLMIQIIGVTVLTCTSILKNKKIDKKIIIYLFKIILLLFFIIGINFLGDYLGYHTNDWKEYNKYNKARANLEDYYGYPQYEEAKDILNKYNVNELEYNALLDHTLIVGNIKSDCLLELTNYQKKIYTKNIDLKFFKEKFIYFMFSSEFWKISRVMIFAWICIVIWIVFMKCWNLFFPLCGLFLSCRFIWIYLFYLDRAPVRVIFPLYLAETLFIFILFMEGYKKSIKSHKSKFLSVLMWMIIGFFSCATGFRQYRDVLYYNSVQSINIIGLKTIHQYCNQNIENTFILDANAFQYFIGSAFETEIYGPSNRVYTHNWYMESPPMQHRISNYVENFEKDIYYIVLDELGTGNMKDTHSGLLYLINLLNREPYLYDIIKVTNGGTYLVYCFPTEKEKVCTVDVD